MAATPTNFDTTRLRFGDMIAGIAGVVLLISLFLDWYSVNVKAEAAGVSREQDAGSGNAFESLGFIDILLLILAIVLIGIVVLRALNMIPRGLPVSPGMLLLGAGGLALLLVLFRLIITPDFGGASGVSGAESSFGVSIDVETSRAFGIFIALLAAAAATVGGWLTWNEEGKPMPGSAGSRGGAPAGGGGAIGGGQPGGGYAQPPAAAQPAATAVEPAAPAPAGGAAAQPADWYPDPRGEKRLRYWDGTQWTDHTAD